MFVVVPCDRVSIPCYYPVSRWRRQADVELMAHVSEGYYRAYKVVVSMQQLTEIEEIMAYKEHPDRQSCIRQMWRDRLDGCQRSVEVCHHQGLIV